MPDEKLFQRHNRRILFDNHDLDFYLLQFLSYVAHGGAAVGECLRAAAQVDERDPENWVAAWGGLADDLDRAAAEAEAAGHRHTARQRYLRATTYNKAASVLMPPDARLRDRWQRLRASFRRAIALPGPLVEPMTIPYSDWAIPGYLVHGTGEGARPTVILVGGGECYAEEMYFWAGVPGARRGYHVLLTDLPAQAAGPLLGFDVGAALRESSPNALIQGVLGALVDALLARPDVDGGRLAVYGISGGGYLMAAGLATEPRIAAAVLSTPITDLYRVFEVEWPPVLRAVPAFVTTTLARAAARVNPVTRITLQKALATVGAPDVAAYMTMTRQCVIDPADIRQPVLCLAGAGDPAECLRQTRDAYARLPHPARRLVIFDEASGADAHCQVNNPALAYETAFDWLDEVL